jgi:hypothetical protein
MTIRSFSIFIGCVAAMIATNADSAQAARTAYTALRVHCAKQAGAYYNPARQRWIIRAPRSSAPVQNFYNCLDAHTMKRR